MVETRRPGRKARRKPQSDQRFSTYLRFGYQATTALGVFLLCYALLLLGLFPLLRQAAPSSTPSHRGEVLQPVVHDAVAKIKDHIPKVPREIIAEGVGALRKRISDLRKHSSVNDATLLKDVAKEFEELRRKKRQEEASRGSDIVVEPIKAPAGSRPGVIVLGMHRSGTSMLSGLMVTGQGYKVGGPLIGGAFDNEKGFFELVDAVLQNDEFMNLQRVWWSAGVMDYDPELGLKAKKNGKAKFKHGANGKFV